MSANRQPDDPLTSVHILTVILCSLGFALDLLEISLGDVLSTVATTAPYSLRPAYVSVLLGSAYAGAALGAPLPGWLADRRGIRKILLGTLLWLGITSLLAVSNPNLGWFTTLRFLSGIALGAYPPLMIAYLTAVLPARRRGTLIFTVYAIAYLAPPATILAVRHLTPVRPFGIEAWHLPFLAGGLLALLVGGAFEQLPEVTKPPGAASMRQRLPARRFLLAAVLYFLHPWATIPFSLLSAPFCCETVLALVTRSYI